LFKPRCLRCLKSKKGCDRQRPCARCKEAGIGSDGCIPEAEQQRFMVAPTPDYDRLRRSFSATADLTPPSAQPNTMFDSDPRKKRMLPPSSEDESPVKKKVRLSLPWEEEEQEGELGEYRSEIDWIERDENEEVLE
jgi:hypothetical protein